ncbi:hypothetical protein DSCO28_69850 [Desulfosarcina ovata subsp. sediminis]|uniref:Uncharacterized protein n=1 Tax=Desulfosarcina ovata subsp. sediminis TaxID=885957 RepID=A0A5K8A1J3_9BACT|nr:hypothetical protein [Desulfosarcina ovata]BBO86419.1 hypothetical protein DSCO28_69850 [Desulfosarcina ovata subsp. sediminis]
MNSDGQSVDLSTENSESSSITTLNLLNNDFWETLNESADLFFKSLKLGRVRGVVSIVDFPNSGSKDNSEYLQLIQELINRDIMVTISSGETVGINMAGMIGPDFFQRAGDGIAEFCNFIGILPVLYIGSTIDKSDILDFYNGLAQHAAVEKINLPTAAIAPGRYQEQIESPGTVFTMEDGPAKTVDLIDAHIHDKRLGIQWCDRCGGRFSPFS